MTRSPEVSVLMSVYNEEPYIRQAVDSILDQTYEDLEVIVVDDNSDDGTTETLRSVDDPRLVHVENDRNVGFVESLNRGLDLCRGTYVARMDGDDVARPDRLEKQVRFLESHPEVGIVGSYWENFTNSGDETQVVRQPETDAEIRWVMLLRCPFGHPTITVERRVLEENNLRYSLHYPEIEDYELWPRVLKHTRGANIPEPLVYHRVHEDNRYESVLHKSLREQDKLALRTIREYVPAFETTQEEVSQLRVLVNGTKEFAPYSDRRSDVELIGRYLDLLRAFDQIYGKHRDLDAANRIAVRKAMKRLRDAQSTQRGLLLKPNGALIFVRAFKRCPITAVKARYGPSLSPVVREVRDVIS